ncbi:MAG: Fic family protein [Gemmatimonadota bacterium]|nr:Fic family protein [Gemmatimonadota bacterium]
MKPRDLSDLLETIPQRSHAHRLWEIIKIPIGPAPGGKYLHWDHVFHRDPPADLTPEEWWLAIKLARNHLYQELPFEDRDGNAFKYALPEGILRQLHLVDRKASGTIGASEKVTSPEGRNTYLLRSLVEEAITSSQLEGAATTRNDAKEMLRLGRKPRDRGEQMIYNNYRAMRSIRDQNNGPLTPEFILELQRILTENAIDDPTAAGRFRRPDENVEVYDEEGQLLHTPPKATELPNRIQRLCDFANESTETTFTHPVVRAIVLHFLLGYDHPFVDGNGRTARALFYWSMKRSEYWLCEYLSISRILRKAPAQYARSFLYTETDDNDVTYFIEYQLRVILRAIDELHAYLDRKALQLKETEILLRKRLSVWRKINHRQIAVLNHAVKHPHFQYTFESHKGSNHIAYQTARTDLLELVKLGFLDQVKRGRKLVFVAPPDLRQRIETATE